MMKLYFTRIVDINNISQAYLEIIEQFEKKNRTISYFGFDGKNIGQYDLHSEKLIHQIREELIEYKPIDPALKVVIPKRNKFGTRDIYIHSIKERVKAQAVYRIVEPIFDNFFSRFLYSYRSSHPHFKALKTIVRRYHKDQSGFMIIGDISSYSDIINPVILKKKIKQLNFDLETQKIINLYVDAQYIKKGIPISLPRGVITGLPMMVLFNNLYLDYFDKIIGNEVNLYRRIGDDFVAFDTKEKLKIIEQKMQTILKNIEIDLEFQKIKIQKVSESFDFLGYNFLNGQISILHKSIKNIQTYLRLMLRFNKNKSIEYKIKNLKKILFGAECIKYYFIQLVRQYNHANNISQAHSISDYFFKRLTIYFFGSYSSRNQRKTLEITKYIRVPSFMRYYLAYHTGKITGKDLKNIR